MTTNKSGYDLKYYELNRDKILAKRQLHYEQNRDKMLASRLAYRERQREIIRLKKKGLFVLLKAKPRRIGLYLLTKCNPEKCDNDLGYCEFEICLNREYTCDKCSKQGHGKDMVFVEIAAQILCKKCNLSERTK